jgi:hypothetical protein
MAFNMKPGRLSFQKTGHGLPSAFLQTRKPGETSQAQVNNTNSISGEDLKEKARQEALKKQQEAGPNKGDSKAMRTFEGTASATVPGDKVEKPASTPQEIAKWKNAKAKAEQEGKPFGERYNPKTITEKATVTDIGTDKPALTTTPAITTTPKPNPVTDEQSRTIYSIQRERKYGQTDQTGVGGLVTLSKDRVDKENQFVESYNKMINNKYQNAVEGSAAARGLTGPKLEERNAYAARMREKLTRQPSIVTTTEADKKDAVNATNAMNRAMWDTNIEKNKAEGIDRVVQQKRSENKKVMKKSPAKQMKSKAKAPVKMKKY